MHNTARCEELKDRFGPMIRAIIDAYRQKGCRAKRRKRSLPAARILVMILTVGRSPRRRLASTGATKGLGLHSSPEENVNLPRDLEVFIRWD